MKLNMNEEELIKLVTSTLNLTDDQKLAFDNLLNDLLAENQIRQSIEDCRVKMQDLELTHRKSLAGIGEHIRIIQSKCTHRSTSYDPDPSGNNDSTTTCDICGKVL